MNWSNRTEARTQLRSAFVSALLLFLFGMSFAAQAQTVQTNQAELARQTQPQFTPTPAPGAVEAGQAVASPNDVDLGEQQILKRTERYQPFTATASAPIYYTSNVALTDTHVRGDVVEAPTVGVFYQPKILPNLYGLVDVRQQFFVYDKYSSFDFGSMDVEAGLSYFLPQFNNLILRVEYDFNRLTLLDSDFDEFYTNHSIIPDVELPVRIDRAQQVSFGVDANISLTADHSTPRRNDYEEYVTYAVQLTRALTVSASGRVALRAYHAGGRFDTSAIVSLNAVYQVTPWWSLSAISSYAHNDSNRNNFSYDVGNLGGAVSLGLRF
jgi:Putative beta-barrel porin 2